VITEKELNPHGYPTTPIIDKNLAILFQRMNELRGAYGHPMIITSGLRSDEQQAALIAQGKTNAKMSKHLAGLACDVYDPEQKLQKWILDHPGMLERIGIWCEDFKYTPNWVHCQVSPPGSGKRFFIP
jgi:hypothetical protein